MSTPILLLPEAEQDVAAALRWYEERRRGLGHEFLGCLDAAFQKIQRNPALPQKVHRDVRRVLVRRFPYGVHYILAQEAIVVVAVFHGRRDPTAWMRRRASGIDEEA